MNREEAVAAVEKFMNFNYPCDCSPDDPNCPGNSYEAVEIIDLMESMGVKFD